jgi:hypothetical protein
MMDYGKDTTVPTLAIKQTEVNTIAASLATIGQGGIQDYHQ